MSRRHKAVKICQIYLKRECRDYKTYLVLLLMLMFAQIYTEGIRNFAVQVGYGITPWISVFITTTRFVRTIYAALFLLLVCNVPFRRENDMFFLLRSGRFPFCMGNVLYLIVNAGCFSLLQALFSFLWGIGNMEWSMKWGKVLGTLALTDAGADILDSLVINAKLIRFDKPLTAFILAYLLIFFCYFFLGLVLFVCNLHTKNMNRGLCVCVCLILVDFVLQTELIIARQSFQFYLSPVTWSNLTMLDLHGNATTYPSLWYAVMMYVVCIASLIMWIVHSGRKIRICEEYH